MVPIVDASLLPLIKDEMSTIGRTWGRSISELSGIGSISSRAAADPLVAASSPEPGYSLMNRLVLLSGFVLFRPLDALGPWFILIYNSDDTLSYRNYGQHMFRQMVHVAQSYAILRMERMRQLISATSVCYN
jgi:hypothetical protein